MPQDLRPSTGTVSFVPKLSSPLPSQKLVSSEGNSRSTDIVDSSDMNSNNNNDNDNHNMHNSHGNKGEAHTLQSEEMCALKQWNENGSMRSLLLDNRTIATAHTSFRRERVETPNSIEMRTLSSTPLEMHFCAGTHTLPRNQTSEKEQSSKPVRSSLVSTENGPSTLASTLVSQKSSAGREALGLSLTEKEKGDHAKENEGSNVCSVILEVPTDSAEGGLANFDSSISTPQGQHSLHTMPAMSIIAKAKTRMTAAISKPKQNPLVSGLQPHGCTAQSLSETQRSSHAVGLKKARVRSAVENNDGSGVIHKEQQLQQWRRSVPQACSSNVSSLFSGDLVHQRSVVEAVRYQGEETALEKESNEQLGEAQSPEPHQSQFNQSPKSFQHGPLADFPHSPTDSLENNQFQKYSSFEGTFSIPVIRADEESCSHASTRECTSPCNKDGESAALLSATLPMHLSSLVPFGSPGENKSEHACNERDITALSTSGSLDGYHTAVDSVVCAGAVSHTAVFDSILRSDNNSNNSNRAQNVEVVSVGTSEGNENIRESDGRLNCSRGLIHDRISSSDSSNNNNNNNNNKNNENDNSNSKQIVSHSAYAAASDKLDVHPPVSNSQAEGDHFLLVNNFNNSSEVDHVCFTSNRSPDTKFGAALRGSAEGCASVLIEPIDAPRNVEETNTISPSYGDQTNNQNESVNANVFSMPAAHDENQQWLHVPALFYLVFSLIKWHEVKQHMQPQPQSYEPTEQSNAAVFSSTEASHFFPPDSGSSPGSSRVNALQLHAVQPSPKLIRRLAMHISRAVLSLRFVLLNPRFTRWDNSELRRAVVNVADAWELGGPMNPEFEKASFLLLGLVSANCGGQIRHTKTYTMWQYAGSMFGFRNSVIFSVVTFVLVMIALMLMLVFGDLSAVSIALSASVAVITLLMTIFTVFVIDHNDATSKFADYFYDEMINEVGKMVYSMGEDIEFRDSSKSVSVDNESRRAVTAASKNINSNSTENEENNKSKDNVHSNNISPGEVKEEESPFGQMYHPQTRSDDDDDAFSSGIFIRRNTHTHTPVVTFATCPAPQEMLKHEHSDRSSYQKRQLSECVSGKWPMPETFPLRGEMQSTAGASLGNSDAHNEAPDERWRDSLKTTARSCSCVDVGHEFPPGCDIGKNVTQAIKSTHVPSDMQNSCANELSCVPSESILGDDRHDTRRGSRISFIEQQMPEEHRQDLMLCSHMRRGSARIAASISPISECLSAQPSVNRSIEKSFVLVDNKEKSTPLSLPLRAHSLQASMHGPQLYELLNNERQRSPNLGALSPVAATHILRDSIVSSKFNGIAVTALVYSSASMSDLGSGLLDPLWSRNFIVLRISTLEALDTVFQHGPERFKVFLLNSEDLNQEQLRFALSRTTNQLCQVFFFSSCKSTMPAEIPQDLRLEVPLSDRDMDTVLLSCMGVKEEIRCVNVFRSCGPFNVPPYRLGRRLGGGAFGNVFEAEIEVTGIRCAVKHMYIRPDDNNEGEGGGVSAHLKEIAHEVEIMSQLCHPNIVQYLFCERDDNCVSIFMELCSGGSLSSLIARGELRTAEQVKRILREIISAVSYLHSKHIVHRDIKPENILFSDGLAKVGDFGTAVLKHGALSNVKGTFAYMAPEVLVGDTYDKSCDVWSIGCIAAEALGVPLPHRALNLPALCDTYRRMSPDAALDLSCDEPLVASFLRLCLRRDPQARATVDALLEHRLLAPGDGDGDGAVGRWMERAAAAARRRRWPRASGTATGSGSGSGTGTATGGPQRPPPHPPHQRLGAAPQRPGRRRSSGGGIGIGGESDGEGGGRGGEEAMTPNEFGRRNSTFGSLSAVSLRSAQLGLKQTPWESPLSPFLQVGAVLTNSPIQEKM